MVEETVKQTGCKDLTVKQLVCFLIKALDFHHLVQVVMQPVTALWNAVPFKQASVVGDGGLFD